MCFSLLFLRSGLFLHPPIHKKIEYNYPSDSSGRKDVILSYVIKFTYIVTNIVAAKANAAEIIFFGVTFSRRIRLIKSDIAITPPVIIGYCTDAGRNFSDTNAIRFPKPQKSANPTEYISPRLFKPIGFRKNIAQTARQIITAMSLLSIIKLTLPTAIAL